MALSFSLGRLMPSTQSLIPFVMINMAFGPLAVITLHRSTIALELQVPQFSVTVLYGLYFLLAGLGGRYFRKPLSELGLKLALLLGSISIGIGSAWCAYANSLTAFSVAFLFLVSLVGTTPFLAPLAAFVVRINSSAPAIALATATAGQLTSFGLWSSIFEILGLSSDWRTSMWVAGPLGSATLFILIILLRIPVQFQRTPKFHTSATSLSFWPFRMAAGAYCMIGAAGTLMITSLAIVESGKSSLPRVMFLMAIFSSCALLGRMLFAMAFDYGHRLKVLWGAVLSFSVSVCIIGIFSDSLVAIRIGSALLGFGYGGFLPVIVVYCTSLWPHKIATITSLLFYWGSAGIAIGSIISGLASEYQFFAFSLLLGGGMGCIALALWCAFEVYRVKLERPTLSA